MKNKTKIFGVLIGAMILVIGCSSVKEEDLKQLEAEIGTPKEVNENQKPKSELYPVVEVVDGDTVKLLINGETETLRLIGVDTPETRDPRKPVQCFGKEASNKTKELLEGQKVRITTDETQGVRDKYNRLLTYVYLEDGTMLNQYLIQEGFAHEYTYNIAYQYQKEFQAAEKEARENKRGLWGDLCNGDTTQAAKNIKKNSEAEESEPSKVQEDKQVIVNDNLNTKFKCDCSKTCSQMAGCEEAEFQLNNCGCSERDSDGDGVPCESLCR